MFRCVIYKKINDINDICELETELKNIMCTTQIITNWVLLQRLVLEIFLLCWCISKLFIKLIQKTWLKITFPL